MKLITNSSELKSVFKNDFKWCEHFYCVTAWASCVDGIFENLSRNRKKIVKMIVGLHFYQTHPDFIEEFLNCTKVRFAQQTQGTFHPKVYFFEKDGSWRMIVGSANFTKAAFSLNTEVCCHLSNDDDLDDSVKRKFFALLNDVWGESECFSQKSFEKYKLNWKRQRKRLKKLSGEYDSDKSYEENVSSKPIYLCQSLNLSWPEFYKKIENESGVDGHYFAPRLSLLRMIHRIFEKKTSLGKDLPFSLLSLEERQLIAGEPVSFYVNGEKLPWGFFGSMKGAGTFHKYINDNDENISKALECIPMHQEVTRDDYDRFVDCVIDIYGMDLPTASRLLAMKRPDFFVAVNKKNVDALCAEFGVPNILNKKKEKKYSLYWDQIINRIHDSIWWNSKEPESNDEDEVFAWHCRAAFLDSLFYEE